MYFPLSALRRKGRQRMRWLDSITDSMDVNLSKLQETVKGWGAWLAAVHGVAKIGQDSVTKQQQYIFSDIISFFFKKLFLAALGLLCGVPALSSCGTRASLVGSTGSRTHELSNCGPYA